LEKTGFGLIETVRVREGRIPFLERHLARLERSLRELGLPSPRESVAALVAPFAGLGDAVLRIEVRDGLASVTVREVPLLDSPVVITASELHRAYPHKTTERDCFMDALREAEVAEADDALLVTRDGCVAEGTAWNVFWWDADRLHTPALELGILPGIGRTRVLELVPRVQEGRYPRAALDGKSVFFTNAVRGVVPIAELDGAMVPPYPRTDEVTERFWPEGG
jgi:branched-subunit amino acid aminotransferase/4-amino-4-deoxychorismate lyase